MKLIFVRHGDPDYIHDSLTAAGRAEATALNRRLRQWKEDGIAWDSYASPLGRAQLTASLALAGTGYTPRTLPWLEEFRGRLADGDICWDRAPSVFTGDPDLHNAERWQRASIYRNTNVAAVQAETVAGLNALLASYGYHRQGNAYRTDCETKTDAVVVLFAHMAITLDCLSILTGTAAPVWWQQVFLPPASLTIVGTQEQEPGQALWRTQCIGDVLHLKQAGVPVSGSGYFAELFPG